MDPPRCPCCYFWWGRGKCGMKILPRECLKTELVASLKRMKSVLVTWGLPSRTITVKDNGTLCWKIMRIWNDSVYIEGRARRKGCPGSKSMECWIWENILLPENGELGGVSALMEEESPVKACWVPRSLMDQSPCNTHSVHGSEFFLLSTRAPSFYYSLGITRYGHARQCR